MTGEARIVRGALIWSVGLGISASVTAGVIAGPDAAASVACASSVVILNLMLTALFDRLGRRFDPHTQVVLAVPMLATRMIVVMVALSAIQVQPFIDPRYFVAAFCATLFLALAVQSRGWKRTPWLALAFTPAKKETV